MKVKIKKLNPNAKMPTQGTDGAAGFDLYATKGTMLVRGYPQKVPTGLAFEIPPGYVGVVYSRSSTAMKGIVITPLLVDADYRGEVFVLANYLCTDSVSYKVKAGDRIAQMRIEKLVDTGYEWADELSVTAEAPTKALIGDGFDLSVKRICKLWQSLDLDDVCVAWRDASNFARWAIRSGFARGATLEKRDPTKPHHPNNSYWRKQ